MEKNNERYFAKWVELDKYLLVPLPIRDTITSGQAAREKALEVEEAKGSGGWNIQNRCLFPDSSLVQAWI